MANAALFTQVHRVVALHSWQQGGIKIKRDTELRVIMQSFALFDRYDVPDIHLFLVYIALVTGNPCDRWRPHDVCFARKMLSYDSIQQMRYNYC